MGVFKRVPGKSPEDRPEQVALALEELRRRAERLAARSESLSSRAGILVATSALVATLQQGVDPSPLMGVAAALSLLAAVFGLVAIFPNRTILPSVRETRKKIYQTHEVAEAQWWLVDQLVVEYESAAPSVHRRGMLLRIGFIVLGSALLFTVVAVLIPIPWGEVKWESTILIVMTCLRSL